MAGYTLTTSQTSFTVTDSTTNTSNTSLTLVGKNYPNYGQILQQDLINMLQNWAAIGQPTHVIPGQLWWDTSNLILKVYSGTAFKNLAAITSSATTPSSAVIAGDLWFDSNNAQLNVYTGAAWQLVGPVYTNTQGKTAALADTITDIGSNSHTVLKLFVGNTIVAIVSKDATFTPATPISGFATINPGYNNNTNIFGVSGSGTLVGIVLTNAQPYINSLGTLSSLTVSSPIVGSVLYNAATVTTAAQPNITSTGTLTSVTSTGTVAAPVINGGTIGNTGAIFTGISATVNTVNAGQIGNASTTNLIGTLTTAAQPNITSTGTLGSLTVTNGVQANAHTGVAVYAGTIGNSGANHYGATVVTTGNIYSGGNIIAAATTATTNETTGSVVVAGGVGIAGSLYVKGALTVVGTTTYIGLSTSSTTLAAPSVNAGLIGNSGALLQGTLIAASASQPNITTVGTLVGGTWNSTIISPTYGGTGINNGTNTLTLTGGNYTLNQAITSGASPTFAATNFTGSSGITGLGTITSGIWQGTLIGPTYGGTGVNNGTNTLTLTGSFTLNQSVASGASPTFTATNFTGTSGITGLGTVTTGAWNASPVYPQYGGTGVNNGTNTLTISGASYTLNQSVASGAAPTFAATNFTGSSGITGLGTIATGVWNGTAIGPTYGGTGVNNGTNTLTVSGNYTLNQSVASGAAPTFTATNITGASGITGLGTVTVSVVSSANITATTANVYAAYHVANTATVSAAYYWANGVSLGGGTGGVTSVAGGQSISVSGTGNGPYTGAVTIDTIQGITTSSTPTFAGLTVPSITHSGTSGTGDIGASGNKFGTVYATAATAQYADLAEKYAADAVYKPGTVVEFGGEAEVTISDTPNSIHVAGIVSSKPAYLMNDDLESEYIVSLALVGRVPCKVIGPVRKGNMMVSAGNGMAKAFVPDMLKSQPDMGSVLGKALENINDDSIQIIEVVVGVR